MTEKIKISDKELLSMWRHSCGKARSDLYEAATHEKGPYSLTVPSLSLRIFAEMVQAKTEQSINDNAEWVCPECNDKGTYQEIRTPIDRGVDSCPECGTEVKPIL